MKRIISDLYIHTKMINNYTLKQKTYTFIEQKNETKTLF